MEELHKKGPDELKLEIQSADLCTGCGMCVGMCPHIKVLEERVTFVERCGRDDGHCYVCCPRTATDVDELDRMLFGAPRTDPVLGSYRTLAAARSADGRVQESGQYGGVASSLVIQALESGLVEAALLTGVSGRKLALPVPVVARTREEVLACAGSKYSAAPTLSALHDLLKSGKPLAIVGRPCQVTAVRKLQKYLDVPGAANIKLVVGLFCLWALDYRKLKRELARHEGLTQIRKMDIPKDDDFILTADNQTVRLKMDTVREMIRPSCQLCFDVTAELADISLGSTEWQDDWNTLLVRSEAGQALAGKAIEAGLIETKDFPADREQILRVAVRNKKARVIQALSQRGNQKSPLLYLHIGEEQRKAFGEGGSE